MSGSLPQAASSRWVGAGGSGRGVRIAIIDSGVHAAHPHVRWVAGGVTISEEGEHPDYADRLGHGTRSIRSVTRHGYAPQPRPQAQPHYTGGARPPDNEVFVTVGAPLD